MNEYVIGGLIAAVMITVSLVWTYLSGYKAGLGDKE